MSFRFVVSLVTNKYFEGQWQQVQDIAYERQVGDLGMYTDESVRILIKQWLDGGTVTSKNRENLFVV